MLTKTMVSDQEIAKGVEILLSQSDPKAFTTLNDVVQQLEAKLGFDLSHKALFVRDQISLLLRSHTQSQSQSIPVQPKDHFAFQNHPQFAYAAQHPQFHPHFALQQQHHQQLQQQQRHHPTTELNFSNPTPPPPQPPQPQPQVQPPVVKLESNVQSSEANSSEKQKKSAGTKRRGGPGGLNKLCGVSPELQAVVGEPALARTEIVKQLWAYIKRNNLQDPSNKRKIICDDALRVVFETDCTDMFKMNKLLAKHIIRLEPTKESSRSKRVKVQVESETESTEPGLCPVVISEALSNFLGTEEREMLQSEVLKLVWEYIKANNLEDPRNSMVIICDAKLRELIGCESISTLGISELLARHHLFKR